ncbi:uncharacterized protein LOC143846598 [Tasmannia lanceolata]|uniref:uncharacterized protein LOC143846598 n=1 Tax=Tasmannia lanceolata TaxID=3420 RepID=UPI0040629CFB
MAVEMCSETSFSSQSCSMSPRISFSCDLSQTENISEPRLDTSLLDSSSPDFDFGITDPCEQGSSSADELFFNGKILPIPIQIQSKTSHVFTLPNTEIPLQKLNPPQSLLPPLPPLHDDKKESLREILEINKQDEKPNSKSFWRFSRSSSFNCGGSSKKSLICSLPPLLSRSYSTGSTNPKSKDACKSSQKPPLNSNTKISWPSSKPPTPLKKNNFGGRNLYGSYNNGGVRINPVLNVPPPYISKGTTSLFSFFLKDTKNKKSSSVTHPYG